MNFSKALDKVSHRRLLDSLRFYREQDRMNDRIKASLENKSQRLVVGIGVLSRTSEGRGTPGQCHRDLPLPTPH